MAQSVTAGPVRLTVFEVGEVEFAVSGRIPRSLPAPSPPPAAVRHGEQDFPVVEVGTALGAPAAAAAEPMLFLVDDQGCRRALLVERLIGAESFDLAALQPVPPVYPEAERRRWRGVLPRADGSLVVLLRLEELPVGGTTAGEG